MNAAPELDKQDKYEDEESLFVFFLEGSIKSLRLLTVAASSVQWVWASTNRGVIDLINGVTLKTFACLGSLTTCTQFVWHHME